jgi:hypothetical protein
VKFCRFLLQTLIASFVISSVHADTFVLEPVADTQITDSLPNGNYANEVLSVFTEPQNTHRTLMRFDLEQFELPLDHQPVSAVLTLAASTFFGLSLDRPMEIYQTTVAWTETAATWNQRTAGVAWTSRGGDYVGRTGSPDVDPYATTIASPPEGGLVTWDITELALEWLDGTPNHGLLLRSHPGNHLVFFHRGATDPARRPKLTITTEPALPRLRIAQLPGGEVSILWRGETTAVLEQNDALSSAGWQRVEVDPVVVGNTTQVRVPASESPMFFRLKKS